MKSKRLHNPSHSVPIQIRFSDIDRLNHVSNSVYHQYFDLGRLKYFTEVLTEQMDWTDEGLVMVSTSVDFLSPIKPYDSIEVRTQVVRLGNKSLDLKQSIVNTLHNTTAATSSSVMVAFNSVRGESVPIPELWRLRLLEFEGEWLLKEV